MVQRSGVETLCRVSVKTEKQILGILSELRLFSGRMCETLMQPQCATLTVDAIAILIVRMQVLFCYFAFLLNKLCLCRCTCFPRGPILCLFSSIFYHSGVLEPIPAVSRTGEVASLLQSIEHRDKQLFTLAIISGELPISLTCMSLGYRRKPGYLREDM